MQKLSDSWGECSAQRRGRSRGWPSTIPAASDSPADRREFSLSFGRGWGEGDSFHSLWGPKTDLRPTPALLPS